MKRRKRMSRQTRKRIKGLREEIERLPGYVLQEIRAHPTEQELLFMDDFEPENYREHEMSIRW